ncbi:hypothetical protein OLEAN_C25060 [Oleispira antarctica RB-8]|uniref:Uncharacterized protein n=1 Tax=Oleispira antarctica RB-8 TaxID=698738 RepID=R4YNU3_OLEAN|nr:hypothetical protein OLEAN_C25060 [Oleispira antarctica RB-8]
MSFFKLLKSINDSMKEASSKFNDSVEYKVQIHSIDTAFKIEETFLDFVVENTKQHLNNKEFYCKNFQDATDKSHSIIALMNEY